MEIYQLIFGKNKKLPLIWGKKGTNPLDTLSIIISKNKRNIKTAVKGGRFSKTI